MMIDIATYVMLLVPVLACGGAMTRMMIECVRREASKLRVERALLAFWMCIAVLMSVHAAGSMNGLVVSL
ncbi:MAG: hypothetical protein AAFZ01_00820 [Pseudomonadota bacterium]